MEDGQMIEIFENVSSGFSTLYERDGRRIAMLTKADCYGELSVLKRHTETDESFLLFEGEATLYFSDDGIKIEKAEMEIGKLYNVPKNTWHHLCLSDTARLIAAERCGTSKENTESKSVNEN